MRHGLSLLCKSVLVLCLAPALCGTSVEYAAQPGQGPARQVWRVGPEQPLKTPSAAAARARDGDVILVDPARYAGDVAVWTQDHLTIRGTGPGVRLNAAGQAAEGKAIWVVKGNHTTIEGIHFSGARVPDGNGAGIRQEGAGLTLRSCIFTGNQDGLLTGVNLKSDILISQSIFRGNGGGDGYTHNIYIGLVRSFTLVNSLVTGAKGGHQVKSRARSNDLRYNTISDGPADGSYSVDLPNGGDSTLVGNLITQGSRSPNSAFISYGREGLTNPSPRIRLVHNTLRNQLSGRGVVVGAQSGSRVWFTNNVLAGDGDWLEGVVAAPTGATRANVRVPVDQWRPGPRSPLLDAAVAVPRVLRPAYTPAGVRLLAREAARGLDVGAFEYQGPLP